MVSPAAMVRSRFIVTARRPAYADLGAVTLLLLLTVIGAWKLVVGGTAIGMDAATFFYPMYSFLGDSLRSGDIPAWSPYQLSGAPFAADPQSGWTYLPAMIFFTWLPLPSAANSYMVLHLLLAGLSVYALARALGINVPGALLAAIAYEHSGYLTDRNVRCFACTGVTAWLPLTILCAEMAIRSRAWLHRALWWGAAGLALSQILASWLGQGAYYALLALGGYIAYRTLLSPPPHIQSLRARLLALAFNGAGVLVFGFGLAAAGLLPRLEYNSLSNLAGGYAGQEQQAVVGGLSIVQWGLLLTRTNWYYAGGVALALAFVAPVIARRRYAVPFWAALTLAALVLTLAKTTPFHWLMYLLPGFERLHPHEPERIILLVYLGVAMLAGATLSCLRKPDRRTALLALIPAGMLLLLIAISARVSPITLATIALAAAFVATYGLLPRYKELAVALLILVAFADLWTAGREEIGSRLRLRGPSAVRKVDLTDYYRPLGAGDWLQDQKMKGPFRYFGYNPRIGGTGQPYQTLFTDERATTLLVNNKATVLRIHDIQGYNPIQPARYNEFFIALNGREQGYRQKFIFEEGIKSPLLNLLNTRYIVAPKFINPTRPDLQYLSRTHETKYLGSRTRVLENKSALPRAWLVHSAQQMQPAQALEALSKAAVDPRKVALIEEPPPQLAEPADPGADKATITSYGVEHLRVQTQTSAPGMLVLSEMYYPAWKAYVDGKPVHVYVTDYVLRGVSAPAGKHLIELRYESASLRLGMWITLGFCLLLAALAIAGALQRWRLFRTRASMNGDNGTPG